MPTDPIGTAVCFCDCQWMLESLGNDLSTVNPHDFVCPACGHTPHGAGQEVALVAKPGEPVNKQLAAA